MQLIGILINTLIPSYQTATDGKTDERKEAKNIQDLKDRRYIQTHTQCSPFVKYNSTHAIEQHPTWKQIQDKYEKHSH